MAEEYFRIGVITEPHGVKGEVKVYPTGDDVDHLKKVKEIYMSGKDGYELMHCCGMKKQNDRIILQFREITDRDMAEKLRKRELFVDRAHAVPLHEDEYYISDLEGLEVYEEGELIGKLVEVMQTGANDVYEVTAEDGRKLLVPVIPQVVLTIDDETDTVLIRPMEGLFD